MLAAGIAPVGAFPAPLPPDGEGVTYTKGTLPLEQDEETEARLRELDLAFTTRRTSGDLPLTDEEAGEHRALAASQAESIRKDRPTGPATFNAPWIAIGPDPIVQIQRSNFDFAAESGRIGALAIGHNHQFILGAAQGGIWTFNDTTKKWMPRTDNLPSLAIGALAVAPSNDMIVYAGTGEGALSGDSYFGNGVLKSSDGGIHWSHVSGDYFAGVAISRLAVDPANAKHLYASVLRGRGGARRVSPPEHSRFGVWESTDGGVTWSLRKEVATTLGATDIRMDPRNHNILYTSFWGDAIYKSTDGGATWNPIMNGLPAGADHASNATRFNLSISHPSGQSPVLYTGFDWIDATGYHPSRVFKSTDQGANWTMLPGGSGLDKVEDYCGGQCYYDNVIESDPSNPNVVFVAGQFGYGLNPPSGGVFRSDDGGATWRNLGWNMHPDFHALAFDPADTSHVLIGNDGGVYYSPNRGGRPNASDALSLVDWVNMNGTVDPDTGVVNATTGLQIAQFSSFATNPTRPTRFWGGTQDNGTLRHFNASNSYYDVSSGDGGQVVVDPTDWRYVYGNYFGVSPWRVTDGGNGIFTNQAIRNGLVTRDRSDFYPPFVINRNNTSQLYFGTYRLYRTDNSKAAKSSDVRWRAISPDLTSGCRGTAPNGARNCTLSAIGVGGGTGVYTGSLDGFVYFSADAQTSNNPTWTLLGASGQNGEEDEDGHGDTRLPRRPVGSIAVDRSNYRVAYIGYNGYNAATPHRPGHVFKTTNAGKSFADISGNLPDSPVNSLILDPAYPNTLYAGTDVGPFVTRNGGKTWSSLGTGFPLVAVWQLDLDPFHRVIGAGTHGRGSFKITDTTAPKPALVLSKVDSGVPVGPGSVIDYTLTLHNIGNANATGVRITDSIPDNTTFVSADSGGTYEDGGVTWSGLSVPAKVPSFPGTVPTTNGGVASVHLKVRIDSELDSEVKSIVNDEFKATSAEGSLAVGSPTVTPIAPPYSVTIAPASQTDGAKPGKTVAYQVTLRNLGFKTDHYNMSAGGAGTFPVAFYDSTCTIAAPATADVTAGATSNVCVKVTIPANGTGTSTSTVTATSAGSPTVSASATVNTIAVTTDTLLVKEDGNIPNVLSYYTAALTTAGIPNLAWDLDANPNISQGFMLSFKHIVWFTGNSYPAPILPYEAKLKAFLDGGGNLFVSGQDLLDGSAGSTAFVHDYLHVDWNGSEAQNDIATKNVHGVIGSLTAGVGTVPIDTSVLRNNFMDQITPIAPAVPVFKDDAGKPDALSFKGTYRVVFLAFPLEEYGTAAQKADLISRVMNFFTTP